MTGFLNAGVTNPLSRMTVASFEDLGYDVFVDGVDGYSLPSALRAIETEGFDIASREILLAPKGAVTPEGEVIYFDQADR